MKKLPLLIIAALSLTACKESTTTGYHIPELWQTTTSEILHTAVRYAKECTGYAGNVKYGFAELSIHPDGEIYAIADSGTNTIVFSNELKKPEKQYQLAFVAAHEIQHLLQAQNGILFNENNLQHDSRSYEIDANITGERCMTFINSAIKGLSNGK